MKKTKKLGIIIMSVAIAVIFVFTFFFNYLALNKFDNILEQFIGKTEDSTRGDTKDADVEYYKSDFENSKELYEYEENLVAEMAMEGATLLENNGVLPLAKGTTLSLFSHSSVDLVSGGSGSGSGSFELTANLKEGLENAGLKVNETLWKFYESGNGSGYKRGAGSISYGASLDWSINECPLSVIQAEPNLSQTFKDTVAMFVLSRTGGEGADLARDMAAYGGKSAQHYLEPDETELAIIDYLNKNFDDVIILVNANNVMELGWIENYENISAVVNFPGAGRTGTYGLGYMLTGLDKDGKEISASGHLVDTIAYDSFSSPAMQNMGDFMYEGTVNEAGKGYYYVNYAEGIYVGYKYYETRYEDVAYGAAGAGNYDYAATVQYPFGYGLSYTEFAWSDFALSDLNAETGEMTVSLTVTNTGERRGKEVVQVYVQSPFTDYDKSNGVEKASVSLVGFAKTGYIEPDGHEDVTITIDLKDFTSYDSEGAGTYILDAGTYYVTAASDAHKALNNIIAKRGGADPAKVVAAGGLDESENEGDSSFVGTYVQANRDTESYSEGADGEKITNHFTDTTIADAKYLSRTNWQAMDNDALRYGTASNVASGAEIGGKQWQHSLSADVKARLDSTSSLNPQEGKITTTYQFGVDYGDERVDLIDLRGLPFNDPLWDKLLNEMDLDELALLIDECGYCSPEMKSINKPKVTDLDGPAGLNLVVGHGSVPIGNGLKAMTWPSEYMLASTWNADLAFKMGEGVAEDGLYGGVTGWYGPAVNIHRTPFAGRNFEYYSEDSFLSGVMGFEAVNGAATKGMYAYLKHFALNDQETHRDQRGLITWADEQTIREIYLKPFEMVIEDNTVTINYNEAVKDAEGNITGYTMKQTEVPAATGIMSSFNRIGATWAGGNYNLLTEVLREEWGFNGFVITDYEVSDYMFTEQCIAAGGDAKLKTVGLAGNFLFGYSLDGKTESQYFARQAAHHILYTVVNSNAMNGYVHGVEYVGGFAYYKIILIVWDVLAAAGVGVLAFFIVKKVRRNLAAKKENN